MALLNLTDMACGHNCHDGPHQSITVNAEFPIVIEKAHLLDLQIPRCCGRDALLLRAVPDT